MPLACNNGEQCTECFGFAWVVRNRELLVRSVATLLAGQYTYADAIMRGAPAGQIKLSHAALVKLKERLSSNQPGPTKYHRDGWLFQMISWIAVRVQAPANVIMRAPHMQPAEKGIDTFFIEVGPQQNAVTAVTIGEDKATDRPRDTVRDEVWPEFAAYESGERDPELVAGTTMLLSEAALGQRHAILEAVLWSEVKRYRVAVAIPAPEAPGSRAALFRGYEDHVGGAIEKRRADTLIIPNLRDWLDGFASDVSTALDAFGGP